MKIPIIILHGWAANSSAWQTPKKLLEKMGFAVFIPDLPGFGEEPPPKTAWSVSDYADFVLRFAEEKNLEKFALIGHSFGGRIAIKLAALYPEKLEGLILSGSTGIRFASIREKLKVWLFQILTKLGNFAFYVPPFTIFRPLARKILYRLAGVKDYYQVEAIGMKETFKKIVNEDLTPLLGSIKTPTLLLWGKNDVMVPLQHAYLMVSKIPGAKLKIIKSGGHRFPYDEPEIFVKEVVEFLNTL